MAAELEVIHFSGRKHMPRGTDAESFQLSFLTATISQSAVNPVSAFKDCEKLRVNFVIAGNYQALRVDKC